MVKYSIDDIMDVLYYLDLPAAAKRFYELAHSPELSNYSSIQLLREVLEPQYIETSNNRFQTNLNLSTLINKEALAENLKTGNGRIYDDSTVAQILSMQFIEDRLNVGVYWVTGVGKSYFLSACCIEACRKNYRCRFIDDFAISRYNEEGIKILYHLLKTRDDLGTSTMFSCQYSPDEWGKQLSDDDGCYGKCDGIRRRLTKGFTVLIEKAATL